MENEKREKRNIRDFRELDVYELAMRSAMGTFEMSKRLPYEERRSLVDQIRRSSRSICANTAEAWRKRRYSASFVSRLSDAEAEAAETHVWLEFAFRCGYIDAALANKLDSAYAYVMGKLVKMMTHPEQWSVR
jgi:four helix bundle protein